MINDLKDLKKLFMLCRAQGVDSIKLNGVEINFGSMPVPRGTEQSASMAYEDQVSKWANFPEGELTPEQLAFYSAGGRPEDDPENKEIQ